MNKRFVFGLTIGGIAIVAAVLWLFSAILPEQMGGFNFGWAVFVFCIGAGIAFLVRGFVIEKEITLRKLSVYFGAALIIVALAVMVGELALSGNIIFPIIAVVLAVAFLLGFIALGGKKWDAGDNQQPGYKTYRERKAEEEAAKADSESDSTKKNDEK